MRARRRDAPTPSANSGGKSRSTSRNWCPLGTFARSASHAARTASSFAVRGTPSVAELDVEAAMDEEEDVGAEAAEAPAGEATRRARSAWLKRRVIRIA
jgi:hypothetical protein